MDNGALDSCFLWRADAEERAHELRTNRGRSEVSVSSVELYGLEQYIRDGASERSSFDVSFGLRE